MRKWKLIALDLDGTTLTKQGVITDATRYWLAQAKAEGVPFTFATGRHWNGAVKDLVNDLGIEIPVVTSNGAEVHLANGELVSRHYLPVDEVEFLLQLARQTNTHYWGATVEGPVQQAEIPEDVRVHEWLKFGFHASEIDVIQVLWDELSRKGVYSLSNSHPLNIEVNAIGVTKAAGLADVCKICGVDRSQLVAMGDSLNDVPMLEWAGLGIAMGNAQESVKLAADWISRRHDEDGVAYAIEMKVLADA
ncbi:Cof-type HAD-IIB family hydrolase [Alicyclobacillus ferrooxydans]|uniref:Uncharacterized protein n=1 Tax=Alicyclobacillus ferrooxydans TaxID=471514 RepID=A0A0P9EL08_9BACL|nr:Cof-type HAD-IIB family hydrolase [Alicyclobacillus ferrooxydans]KPV43899.1 hypothetical protein AN477_10085 [Alicyclobacillus ferrooxydans]